MPPSHPHSHGPDPDAPPPSPEALGRRRRAVWLMLLLLVPVGLATVIGLLVLWPDGGPTRASQAAAQALPPGTTYPDGRVVSVQTEECGVEATALCATAVVEVLDGPGEGDYVQIGLDEVVVANGVAEGDVLVLSRDAGADGGALYNFSDFARDTPIVTLAVAFALVVGLVARWRGLASLVGLAFAFFVLLEFVLPGLLGDTLRRAWSRWSAPRRSCSSSSTWRTGSPRGRRRRWSARCSGWPWSRSWVPSPSPRPG
ncbi:hypothetical protein [Blastococcus sp. TML/C7B]|uniref:hypothetical protein n=1 Tax=Blastococcus sp. TML/C7B TaxID=2798728 RepID=UPI0028153F13|nr:hypothetical protein [Blastococcus sp. TML/C7B]